MPDDWSRIARTLNHEGFLHLQLAFTWRGIARAAIAQIARIGKDYAALERQHEALRAELRRYTASMVVG